MMNKKFKDLLTSVDVLNTVNGGVSEPFLSFRENKSGREMRVRVPGITREAMQVEINNNQLSVYYMIPIASSGNIIHLPQVIYKQTIPWFIKVRGIKATYEEKELVVRLPFNEMSDGYHKKIEIDEV
jgi:HSP20 family molecular chaperone IbpA